MKITDIFSMKSEAYNCNINPIKHYLDISTQVLNTFNKTNIGTDTIKRYIKETKQFRNPVVKFFERDLKGVRSEKSISLLNYISDVKRKDDIIVPSFTVYFSKAKKRSLHAEFINVNVRERSKHKKLSFKYKMQGDMVKSSYHNVIQKVKKIFNNSLSGAYGSMGTILHNISAHYTLTSITRAVASIGNVIAESFISGNRHYRNPDITFNHIATIVSSLDREAMEKVVRKYSLHLPSSQETMDCIIKSSRKYWRSLEKESIIYEYLSKLSGLERAFILYQNDLYHLRLHNDMFCRSLISSFLNYKLLDLSKEECNDIIDNSVDWAFNLAVHVNSKDLTGKRREKYTEQDLQHLASFLKNFESQLNHYQDLIKVFLITDVFPASLTYVKEMVRESIVLSDTDSTCATYEDWVKWYYGEIRFNKDAVSLSAIVMTFVTQSTDHYIRAFAGNMNVKEVDAKHLSMKNEFFWSVFVNTNVSKHYYAFVNIQEGNVYKVDNPINNLEKKGVNLIVPNVYGPIRELSEKMMVEIMTTIRDNKTINLQYYLDMVLTAEKMILDKIRKGSPDVLKMEKIKEAEGYKKGPNDSPYMYYQLWQDIFSQKYGNAPKPQYMAVKVPTTVTSVATMKNYINNIEDKTILEKMKLFLGRVRKEKITTFRLPLIIVYNKGIPKEVLPAIDYKRVITDNVRVLYMILESLGYYLKDDSTLIEELEDMDFNNIR